MLRRLPKLQDSLPAYAVIVAVVFGWSILTFFWKLPSWLLFLHIRELLTVLAYTLAADLLESLLWMGGLLLVAFLLPARILTDRFLERGSSVSLVLMVSVVLFVKKYGALGPRFLLYSILWLVVTLILAALLAYLSSRVRWVGSAISWFSDRLIVFLFLLIPAGTLSLLVVIVRNLFG